MNLHHLTRKYFDNYLHFSILLITAIHVTPGNKKIVLFLWKHFPGKTLQHCVCCFDYFFYFKFDRKQTH